MGKLELFDIIVINPYGVCQAGDLLTGYVVVRLNESMKMRGTYLTFKGKGHTSFHKGSGKERRKHTCSEHYFQDRFTLFEPGSSETLTAGEHKFEFEYRLPTSAPSSFEGSHGYVRYTLTSHIDKPWKFDHTTKSAFTVLSILDLNQLAEINMPVQRSSRVEDDCCGCCNSGTLAATVTLQRMGFVPGEILPCQVEVNNGTETDASVTIALQQYTRYETNMHKKEEKEVLFAVNIGTVVAKQTEVLATSGLRVPAVPPSDLIGCNIIHIQYLLKVRVSANVDLKIPVQVTIGTIPLRSVVEMYRPQRPPIATPEGVALSVFPDPHGVPSAPGATGFGTDFHTDFSMPPPSYEECVHGKVDIRDEDDSQYTHGNLNYAPVYNYYKWE